MKGKGEIVVARKEDRQKDPGRLRVQGEQSENQRVAGGPGLRQEGR